MTVDKTAITTAGGTVNGQTVTWPDQIIAPGTKEYRIPVTVTGTTLFAEDFKNKAVCRIEERNEELVSNPTYHRCEQAPVSITITKKTGSPAAREEHFLFRIDYQPEEDEDITRTFYGTTIIPPGDDTGTLQFEKLPPGIYTVTEEQSNWRYELAGDSDQEQILKLTKPGQQNSTILFQNNLTGKEWLEGSSDIMNKMKNPEDN